MIELGEELASLEGLTGPHKKVLMDKLNKVSNNLKNNVKDLIIKVNKEADRTGGKLVFDTDSAVLYVGVGPRNTNMSALEAYVHELVHAMTYMAINSNDPFMSKDINMLKKIREEVIAKFSDKDVMKHMVHPDEKVAKDMMDYISSKDVGLHEFVAYAETNETVRSMLQSITLDPKAKESYPDLASKLSGILENLWDKLMGYITGTAGKNGLELAESAIMNIVNANARAQEKKRNFVATKIGDTFTATESSIKGFMDKMEEKA